MIHNHVMLLWDILHIASSFGYYDQAHFTRDITALAGARPTELLASRFPNDTSFRAEE